MTLKQTFLANVAKAINDRTPMEVGGGLFSPDELRALVTELAPQRSASLGGWHVANDGPDDSYLYITLDGSPGQIVIKQESEGFVVDIWNDDEYSSESVATAYALFTDLERE